MPIGIDLALQDFLRARDRKRGKLMAQDFACLERQVGDFRLGSGADSRRLGAGVDRPPRRLLASKAERN